MCRNLKNGKRFVIVIVLVASITVDIHGEKHNKQINQQCQISVYNSFLSESTFIFISSENRVIAVLVKSTLI